MDPDSHALLQVAGLKQYFPIRKGFLKKHVGDVRAVDDVSFHILRGETLGLVGESGCGKTTIGRLILRGYKPTAGQILFCDDGKAIDLAGLEGEYLRRYRDRIQMIFQDPYASLNPRMTVLEIIGEPLVCLKGMQGKALRERVEELLQVVGLDARYASRYPHAFSGGQRQRIGIARALALNPALVVADEAVSALDVSIQAQVINLLEDLQDQYNLTYLFIAHDLAVVEHISDRVAVMYVGKLVELAPTEDLFARPKHPYTEALLSAVPRPDANYHLQRMVLEGEVADPANRPAGCCFHPRCRYAQDICRVQEPPFVNIAPAGQPEHRVACHLVTQLNLAGVGVGSA